MSTWAEKNQARKLFTSAVRRGEIRPCPCLICGSMRVHGHHFDYTKPYAVIWLCPRHHGEHHQRTDGHGLGGHYRAWQVWY